MRLILFLISSLCFGQGMPFNANGMVHAQGGGAITVGAHVCEGSTTGADVTTSEIDTSGSSLLVLFVASYAVVAIPAISDSKMNIWTQRSTYGPGHALSRSTFFYAQNPTVGSGHKFTATGPGTNDYPLICIAAVNSTATSSVYDVENGNDGDTAVTTIQPGSVTPTQNNEIVFSGVTTINTGTVSIDSGYTITDQSTNVVTQHFGGALAYKIQTTAAAVNPTWTFGETVDASSSAATFKAP